MKKKVILITGSSRGIGKLTAIKLAEEGHKVYATMRQPSRCDWFEGISNELKENIILKTLDVTDDETIQNVVSEIINTEGCIDVAVNNAGYGLFTPIELADIEEVKHQFDVNVYGVLRVTQAVLPHMRQQKSGHIINMSSIAGIVSNPGLGIYCGTKHALEAISESLAATVFPWNIKVTVIEPAATATEFADVMALGSKLKEENPYSKFNELYQKRMIDLIKEGQPPQEIADLISDVIRMKNPDFRYQTNERGQNIAKGFIVDPKGNKWINDIKENFSEWLITG
jgi:retinol dehydrogenase-8